MVRLSKRSDEVVRTLHEIDILPKWLLLQVIKYLESGDFNDPRAALWGEYLMNPQGIAVVGHIARLPLYTPAMPYDDMRDYTGLSRASLRRIILHSARALREMRPRDFKEVHVSWVVEGICKSHGVYDMYTLEELLLDRSSELGAGELSTLLSLYVKLRGSCVSKLYWRRYRQDDNVKSVSCNQAQDSGECLRRPARRFLGYGRGPKKVSRTK